MTNQRNYRLVKKIKDRSRFNIENLEHYILSLQVGSNDFQICVTDSRDNRGLLLEDYVFENIDSIEAQIEELQHIFDEHHLLLANFWKTVRLSLKNKKFALIPTELYDQNKATDYIKYTAELNNEEEELKTRKLSSIDAIVIFVVNKRLTNFFHSIYPNLEVEFLHQSSALIKGLLEYNTVSDRRTMFLYVDRFQLHILVKSGSELNFYNSFPIRSFSDYVRYITIIAKDLHLNLEEDTVFIWGYLSETSDRYKELNKYIKYLQLGTPPKEINLGYQFDEIPDHHYYDLYSIHRCD